MSRNAYMIVDDGDNAITVVGANLFGQGCAIVPMFEHEHEALEVLWAMEERGLDKPHRVRKLESKINIVIGDPL